MSRASHARRIATAAAYGGGGLGILTAGAIGLMRFEAMLARRAIGEPTGTPPSADGVYGKWYDGTPLSVVLLGDSSACGLGVEHPHQTPGAMLASGVAECAGRPVQLTSAAFVGAQTSDLHQQLDRVNAAMAQTAAAPVGATGDGPDESPAADVAVIMIGTNDVTHRVRPSTSVRHLDQVVRRLTASGTQVVVATCPDLGTIEPVAQPLRFIARRWSRQLAAAQTIVVVEAGGRTVSLGDILGPEFAASPAEMFGPDRFHPSVAGYASAAATMLPSVCASLGVWFGGEQESQPDLTRGEGVRPIAMAAAQAADQAGTEVAAASVAGRDRGPRGRWVLLRHRPAQSGDEVQQTAEDQAATTD
jgi:lysophospholipase L1-like esterase